MSPLATIAPSQYGRQLHRYLLRRLRRPQDVDDLAQEVYLRLMQMSEEKVVETPLAYLYGIAAHVVADHRIEEAQRDGAVVFDSDEVEDWESKPSCVLPDDLGERLNLQQQIDQAMNKLTPRQLAVILMHKRDGWSYEEISEKLGCSTETVSRHLVYAKTRLRKEIWDR